MRDSTTARRIAAILAAVTVTLAARALAGTATGSLKPTMTIANTCVSTGATVTFPEYLPSSPSVVTAAGNGGTLTCNAGDAWSIKTSKGNNSTHAAGTCGATTCTRAMTNGSGNYVSYDLFVGACCSGTTVWNTTNAIAGTGTGIAQTILFWGEVASGQNVPAGNYTDTVVATYTF